MAISFFDFDQGKDGRQQECMSATGFARFDVTPNSELAIASEAARPGFIEFCATAQGTAGDNPRDPAALTPLQLDAVLEYAYRDVLRA